MEQQTRDKSAFSAADEEDTEELPVLDLRDCGDGLDWDMVDDTLDDIQIPAIEPRPGPPSATPSAPDWISTGMAMVAAGIGAFMTLAGFAIRFL